MPSKIVELPFTLELLTRNDPEAVAIPIDGLAAVIKVIDPARIVAIIALVLSFTIPPYPLVDKHLPSVLS